jgi:probable F420-dependent oxidoreductase
VKFWTAAAFLETEQLIDLAPAVEAAGYHGITVSDHIFFAPDMVSKYPYTPDGAPFWDESTAWPDPWVTIAAMAAVTRRLEFTTNIYVAPARDLFTVAKQVSTASVVSRGRVSLGAAPGWCAEEYAQTGQDFASRGRRLNEMIPALRALWGGGMVEHHGEFYDFGPLRIEPVPAAPVPVLIGGDSEVALRRAARLGDGWLGNAYDEAGAEAVVARMHHHLKEAGRSADGFEMIIALTCAPSVDTYRRFEDLGVTGLVCAPWAARIHGVRREGSDLATKIAALEAFAERIVSKM